MATSGQARRTPTPRTRISIRNHGRRRQQSSVRAVSQCLARPTADLARYPKHVWSPAGGWYAQPANWKANTAVISLVSIGIVGMVFMASARLEHRDKMPEPGRFFPSR
jgi:hypothetical protein